MFAYSHVSTLLHLDLIRCSYSHSLNFIAICICMYGCMHQIHGCSFIRKEYFSRFRMEEHHLKYMVSEHLNFFFIPSFFFFPFNACVCVPVNTIQIGEKKKIRSN